MLYVTTISIPGLGSLTWSMTDSNYSASIGFVILASACNTKHNLLTLICQIHLGNKEQKPIYNCCNI